MLAKQKETAKKWLSKISRNRVVRSSKISETIDDGRNKKKIEMKEFKKRLKFNIKSIKRRFGRKLSGDEIKDLKRSILTQEI